MATVVMPDATELALGSLAADANVVAAVGTRMAVASPKDTSKAWIRVSHIGGPRSLSAPMRLARRILQVDAFAPPTPSTQTICGDEGAMNVALLAEACLLAARGFSNDDGVIAYVEETIGPVNQPDTSRTPPTPRVRFTVAMTIRPT